MAHIDFIITSYLKHFFDDRENILAPVIACDLHYRAVFPDGLFCAFQSVGFRALDVKLNETCFING